jgi:hypothetical protein
VQSRQRADGRAQDSFGWINALADRIYLEADGGEAYASLSAYCASSQFTFVSCQSELGTKGSADAHNGSSGALVSFTATEIHLYVCAPRRGSSEMTQTRTDLFKIGISGIYAIHASPGNVLTRALFERVHHEPAAARVSILSDA